MKYDIWLKPFMPLKDERKEEIIYVPQAHINDERLTYLDRMVYFSLCIREQLYEEGYKDIDEIVKDIKTHPDKNEDALMEYLEKTGKELDTMTAKELKNLPSIKLTSQDVNESLMSLAGYGYIEKWE